MQSRRALILGPAYLDRVLRVDGPLLGPALGGPLDRSVGANAEGGSGPLVLVGPSGAALELETPPGWPGPGGVVHLESDLSPGRWRRRLAGVAWHDDLGGMGAGFASTLGGPLVSALGSADDPTSRAVAALLERHRIDHRPVRVAGRPADWTLLVTSGPHGDKLPLGFRGCHAALESVAGAIEGLAPPDVVVVAGLPNPLAADALGRLPAAVRLFAPSARNMAEGPTPAAFADRIDLLSCNRGEWETLPAPDRERLEACVGLIAVTDGPRGAALAFRRADGDLERLAVTAFPRRHPPRDTNRAGEAFAATLLVSLLDAGWRPGRAPPTEIVESAARRASAASALVLDLDRFGFPAPAEIDRALRIGVATRVD